MKTNYIVRRASKEDLQSIQSLVTACDIDDFNTGEFAMNIEDTWNFVSLEDTCVVLNQSGLIVGYAFIEEIGKGRLDAYGFTHPECKGRGIGSLLLDFIEERGRTYIENYKREDIKYELNNLIPHTNRAAVNLLSSREYFFKRVHSIMSFNLESRPEKVDIPDYIEIRTCDTPEGEREIYEAYCDAFQGSNSFYPKPFEEWIEDKKKGNLDQGLWLMAYIEGVLAGFLMAEEEDNSIWVNLLGTKKFARRKGVGACLLKTMFLKAYERGCKNVSLSVDESNITNASKVYTDAGMKSVFQVGMYGKNI